ncbi:MAG: hypothetical protein JOZ65_26615 [Chloroflexi bacterium]|nr:hypothetical protein [Chloroflexota bacterium]
MPANFPALVPTEGRPAELKKREPVRTRVVGDEAIAWSERVLWALCIGVYLLVFVPGVLGHGDELMVMGRAVGLTLLTAVLGKIAIGLLARASLPEEEGPSAEEEGPIGSRVELVPSTNVAEQEDGAEAA